jgi:cytoskeletal protein CcmA (bactofilin family)
MASLFGSRFGSRSKGDEQPTQSPTPPSPLANPRPTTFSQQPLGFETVLGAGSALEGKLKTEGNIRLDGIFTGTLEISGNVLVGETANISADIDAKNVSIAGSVRGNVSGNKVQLLRTGKVWGNITASALTTEEGAFIDGKITMHTAPAQDNTAQPDKEAIVPKDDDITFPSMPVVTESLGVDDDENDDEDVTETSDLLDTNDTDILLGVKDPDFIEQVLDDIDEIDVLDEPTKNNPANPEDQSE